MLRRRNAIERRERLLRTMIANLQDGESAFRFRRGKLDMSSIASERRPCFSRISERENRTGRIPGSMESNC